MGSVLSPFNAFLLLQGIETVALRVERHVENARKVADFLRNDPRVDWVNYAGFPDSPYYALVQKYLDGNASSLFTFGIKGGMEAGKAFYDALKLITRLVNIGDAKSLACHPASTTHRQMSAEQQRMAGVLPETIRLSIGIEHSDDIIEDIDQALAQAVRATSAARGRGIDRSGPGMTVLFDKRRLIVSPGLAPTQLRDAEQFDRPQNAERDAHDRARSTTCRMPRCRRPSASSCACSRPPQAESHPSPLLLAAVGATIADGEMAHRRAIHRHRRSRRGCKSMD